MPLISKRRLLLPQGRIVAVDNAATLIVLTAEIVDPHTVRQVDSVTYIVTLSIGCSILINGRYEIPRAKHVLVLCSLTQGVVILCIEEHGTHHGLAKHCLASNAIGVRCKY